MPDAGYDAFVSYSHDADGAVGPALRDGLHLFARPWNRLRALRVFCDRRALDPADGLWSTIRQALDTSRFLILVASPGAAASRWVGREIEHWRTGPRRPVLIVRTGGEIVWDDAAGDFDWDRTTALPRALRGWFAEEPQWVDLEVPPGRLSLRDSVFLDAVATLAAPLHGRAKDDLLGEDVAQHRRAQGFRRAMWAGLSVVALLAVLAAAWAATERTSALEQRDKALAGSLVAEASAVRDTQPGLARQLLAAAYRLAPTPQARSAAVSGDEIPRELTTQASALAYSDDGSLLVVARSGQAETPLYPEIVAHVWLYDAQSLEVLSDWSMESHDGIPAARFVTPGLLVLGHGDEIVVTDVTDPRAPAERARLAAPSRGDAFDVAPDGRTLAAAFDDGTVRLWEFGGAGGADGTDGAGAGIPAGPVATWRPCTAEEGAHQVGFAGSGDLLAVGCSLGPDATAAVWDVTDRAAVERAGEAAAQVRTFDVAPDGRHLVAETDGTLVRWEIAPSGDLRDPTPLPLPLDYEGYVSVLAYGDRGRVAVVGEGGYARVWDVAGEPALLVELRLPAWDAMNAKAVALAPGAGALAVATPGSDAGTDVAAEDGTVRLWNLADPLEQRARASVPAARADLDVSADGRTMAGLVDGDLYVADLTDPLRPESLARTPVDIAAGPDADTFFGEVLARLGPDGNTLVIASEGALDVFDLTDRAHPRHVATWPSGVPTDLAFRSDGDLLAVARFDGPVALYDPTAPDGPQPVAEVPTAGSSLVFLPGRPVLAVAGTLSSTIELWDLTAYRTPVQVAVDQSHTYQVAGLAVTGDGLLASVARDSSVRTWRVVGDKFLARSTITDSGDVNDLAVSAGGGRLATLGRDRTLRVYRLAEDTPTLDLSISVGDTTQDLVGFVGEDVLAVRTDHGAVDLWGLDADAALERLCSGTGHTITRQQWARVLPDLAYEPPC
ncbi:hypothetical protein [Promicromonospora sp. NPDC059942]|uniref:hypothetical protein n=1 Tax=Promicromonospora sp. NPDC059942 TaxID=3347009 RepID=UPI00364CDD48